MSIGSRRASARSEGSRAQMILRIGAPAVVVAAIGGVAFGASASASTSTNWPTVTSVAKGGGMKALVAAAKAEGTLNVIALPSNWANYGKQISTFSHKYGIKVFSETPSGSSAQEI